jgi:hypothetical protein
MCRPSRLLYALVCTLIAQSVFVIPADALDPRTVDEQRVQRNQFGAIVKDQSGREVSYSSHQLEVQAREAATRTVREPSPPRAVVSKVEGTTFSAAPVWSYARLGAGIGLSNIAIAQNGSAKEIYVAADNNAYWVALAFNPVSQEYDQTFVSPAYSVMYSDPRISRIDVGNVVGDGSAEIVVAVENGRVDLYDQATKTQLPSVTTGATSLTGLALADVDGDGAKELVVCNASNLYVYSGNGSLEWSLPNVGGSDLVVAQMDNDPALEIAVTNGMVVDCGTDAVQWTWPNGFGYDVEAADIDGDSRSELLSAGTTNYYVFAYDVERQLPKWSFSAFLDIGGITLADMDGDSVPEILVGEQQWGEILVYDAATQHQEGELQNPEHGITNVAVDDVDGDGDLDVLWGSGWSSTGEDHLYVADWNSRQILWQNVDLVGPFVGPQIGDLDGDGRQELVVVSSQSNAGYDGARILVFDARTRSLLATSQGIVNNSTWLGVADLRLRDVDGDGRKEILIATSQTYDGVIEIYDFDGASRTFTLIWTTFPQISGRFESVDAGDVDNDGQMEIVGGGAGSVYVFGFATGIEEWHSLFLGSYTIPGLELADADGDGVLEIAAMAENGDTYVFDGPSKKLEAVLFGPFTALTLGPSSGGLPTFVVGTAAGELVTFAHTATPNPYPYVEVSRQTVTAAAVEGVTYDARGRAWVGSGGRVTLVDSGVAVWSSDVYGMSFGQRVAFLPGSRIFFASGVNGLTAFASGTGFGRQTAGIYVASSGAWFLHDANEGGPADTSFVFGSAASGMYPLVGDWNGDGLDTPGIYNPATGAFFLRDSNAPGPADVVLVFGAPGYLPVVGDWNGDGVDTVGIYDPANGAVFLKNANTSGVADLSFAFGSGGNVVPLAGDWNGDGVDTIGLYVVGTGAFFLGNSNASGPGDLAFVFGAPGLIPVAGDFDGNGVDTIGVYSSPTGAFFLKNTNAGGVADATFGYGPPGATPLIGDWNGE